jgi:methionine-rich copper-binding protein CopC
MYQFLTIPGQPILSAITISMNDQLGEKGYSLKWTVAAVDGLVLRYQVTRSISMIK